MTANDDEGSDEARGEPAAGRGDPSPRQDPVLARVGETSLRMMSGALSGTCVRKCRELVYGSPEVYPWEAVVELVLTDPIEPSELANRGILAQRNWVLRGGAAPEAGRGPRRKGSTIRVAAKTLLAMAIVRGAFYGFFGFAVVVVLLIVKARWPGADIYRLLDWLREALPGLFGGG